MVDNTDDVIDSRDVIARMAELAEEIAENDDDLDVRVATEELGRLSKLAQQGEDYAEDWEHGVALIRDSYFKDYAQELADDIGAINKDASWPLTCIDWDMAARELQQDYTQVDFDGVSYWVR